MPVVWRTFEVTTRVEVLKPSGTTRVWLPAALLAPFQRTLANDFKAEGGTAELVENKADVLGIVVGEFPAGVKPGVTLTSRITTRNYEVDLSKPSEPGKEKDPSSEYFLRPTKLMPTDGIVKVTSDEITVGKKTDVAKARAIYEWIVENTFRNPKTRGCGTGDIRYMLQSKDLGGKCADLNALYVGLAREPGFLLATSMVSGSPNQNSDSKAPRALHPEHNQDAALPGRGLSARVWVGSCRSSRSPQSCTRRATGESFARR
jgi:hypothetical protein